MGHWHSEGYPHLSTAGRRVSLCLMLVSLAACGGGGGGSAPAAAPPAAPPVLFNIQGEISIPDGTAVDADLNDPAADPGFNNLPASAQQLPNPVTVGGYVNVANTGPAGRSRVSGDRSDFYRVNLVANQAITLLIGEPLFADLDLFLWDAAGTVIIDASASNSSTESLVVPADGQYLVEVYAWSDASNYVLSIGQAQPQQLATGARLSDAFVPNEVILRQWQPGEAGAPQTDKGGRTLSRPGLRLQGGAAGRGMLMRLEGIQARRMEMQQSSPGEPDRLLALGSEEKQRKWQTLIALKDLARDPAIAVASLNYIYRPHAVPNDPAYSVQWHYPQISLPAAWESSTGSPAVTVAVVDTGILPAHPDLQGQFVPGFDFISDAVNALDGGGIDDDPTDPGDGGGQTPSSFHGTHVAGTIAAASNNGNGVAGVAWNVNIMPLRVCGLDGCSLYDILQAVRYAAGLPNDSGRLPAAPADVINLSLGGPSFSQAAADLYAQVRQLGVVIVASAGNEAGSAPSYPAAHTAVMAVSAVGIDKLLASYSNFGPTIDVAAPGGDGGDLNGDGYPDFVLSTGGDDSGGFLQHAYTFLAGTSMASPHVAGVIALMRSVNANLTPDDIRQLLVNGELTDDLGPAGRDDLYGHGLINAQKAISAALNAGGNPPSVNPELDLQASALNFGTTMTGLGFTAFNAGGGSLAVTGVSSSAPWLTVQEVAVDGSGLGSYLAIVNRVGLIEGTYTATITVASDANDVDMPVLMQVSDTPVVADAGYLYVLLVNPLTQTAVREFPVDSQNGSYSYEFLGVPAGDYEIVAGSDADNDLVICDPGEACGQFLTLDQPLILSLGADRSNVDFSVGYVLAISSQATGSGGGGFRRVTE